MIIECSSGKKCLGNWTKIGELERLWEVEVEGDVNHKNHDGSGNCFVDSFLRKAPDVSCRTQYCSLRFSRLTPPSRETPLVSF